MQTAGQGDVGYISLKLHLVALADELTAWKDGQISKVAELADAKFMTKLVASELREPEVDDGKFKKAQP